MADWISAIASLIATVTVVIAVSEYFAGRERRRRDSDRERREQARQLTAWAATIPVEGARRYGVVLSNTSGSTFHDVEAEVVLFGESTSRPIRLSIIPPGRYWVEYTPSHSSGWEFPVERSVIEDEIRPYMMTDKYRVHRVTFTDNMGQRWQSDDHARLRECMSTSTH